MEIVDAQVHCWKRLGKRHWTRSYRGANQDALPIEAVMTSMDAVGVDAAVVDVLSDDPGGSWRDSAYAEEAAERHPDRIASVLRGVDHEAPNLEETVAGIRSRRGVLGARLMIATDGTERAFEERRHERLLSAAERHRVPLMLYVSGRLGVVDRIAAEHPDLTLLVDHLGLPQYPRERDEPPFRRLPELLRLARHPNVSLKLIGAPCLSNDPYPHADVWPHLLQLLEAYGVDRLLWGSDFTRLWGFHTYAELVGFMLHTTEISEADKERIMGANLRRVLDWPLTAPAAAASG